MLLAQKALVCDGCAVLPLRGPQCRRSRTAIPASFSFIEASALRLPRPGANRISPWRDRACGRLKIERPSAGPDRAGLGSGADAPAAELGTPSPSPPASGSALLVNLAIWFVFSALYNESTKIIVGACQSAALITSVQMGVTLALLLAASRALPSTLGLPAVRWGDSRFLFFFLLVSAGQWLGNWCGNTAAKSMSVSLLNIVKVRAGAM